MKLPSSELISYLKEGVRIMPKWEIHNNKWADKIGISKDIQNFVNGVIDFPEKCQEFQDFCEKEQDARIFKRGKPTKMTVAPFIKHDLGRNEKYIRKIQLKFLSQKGKDYERAYYLHQILDYLEWWCGGV